MVGLSVGGAKRYLIAFAALIAITLAAVAFFPRGSSLEAARDYEECVEAIMANQSSPASGDEHSAAMTGCNARFAGRRKPGGGYSLRIPGKATTLSGAWRPRDPVDDDWGGARV